MVSLPSFLENSSGNFPSHSLFVLLYKLITDHCNRLNTMVRIVRITSCRMHFQGLPRLFVLPSRSLAYKFSLQKDVLTFLEMLWMLDRKDNLTVLHSVVLTESANLQTFLRYDKIQAYLMTLV